MKGIIKDAVILFIITVIAGVCLGAVHDITLEPHRQGSGGGQDGHLPGGLPGCGFLRGQ